MAISKERHLTSSSGPSMCVHMSAYIHTQNIHTRHNDRSWNTKTADYVLEAPKERRWLNAIMTWCFQAVWSTIGTAGRFRIRSSKCTSVNFLLKAILQCWVRTASNFKECTTEPERYVYHPEGHKTPLLIKRLERCIKAREDEMVLLSFLETWWPCTRILCHWDCAQDAIRKRTPAQDAHRAAPCEVLNSIYPPALDKYINVQIWRGKTPSET